MFTFHSKKPYLVINSGFFFLILEFLFMLMVHQSLLEKRLCVYQVTDSKYSSAGNVSGSEQLCDKTDCCLAIFQIINGQPKVDTLACGIANMVCPDATCRAKPHFIDPYIQCTCRTDLCNGKITWSPETEQPPVTQHYTAASFKILNTYVCLKFFIFDVYFLEDPLQPSCHDYNVQPLCSCQIKASENQIPDIVLQEVLGQGHFASVYQAKQRGSVVAVKVYPANWKHMFIKEKEVYELPLMKHEGIVKFLGTGRKPDNGSLLIVLQYAEYGSLHSFLCKHTSSWMLSMKLCQTLSEGLSYLHSDHHSMHKPPVAHRDLSSSNVLVRADWTCVLSDFGSATILRSCSGHRFWQDHTTNMQFCTLNYMSPEILEGSVNLSSSSYLLQGDIYALGLILWEVWMRCSDLFPGGAVPQHLLPYELELEANVTFERLILYVSEMDRRPSIPENWKALPQVFIMKELLTDCWDSDTDARLTAACVVDRLISL
uniref:receptor protein serine/threonine kinase n=1 Tax=Cyprinodon variegatus TaxID=28743 RepID=A0A3Q2D340_CYPVA